jgi:haloalkane dehalogenase
VSAFFELPAGRMHYEDAGPRTGETLLCLHGNPTWSYFYRRLVADLSDRWRVVAPDHLGCGRSDKPLDWSYRLADHVANLEQLVLGLDLSDITLVLHDWGGAIGMGLARRHPGRIARLVILNSAAFPSPRMPWRIRACRTPIVGPYLVRHWNAFAGLAPRMAVERRLAPDVRAQFLAPYDTPAHRIAIERFVEDIPMSPAHPSWSELDATSRSLALFSDRPACIIWGEKDWCFTPRFRDEWTRRFPKAEVHRLEHAGHWLLEDEPDAVLGFVRGFLEASPLAVAR